MDVVDAPNPNGEFQFRFDFAPTSAGARDASAFRDRIHAALEPIQFVFFGEVEVTWILYQDEQQRLSTPDLADLDNYAKLMCDAIKGSRGILIDDSQIQSLRVSWIDSSRASYFEL